MRKALCTLSLTLVALAIAPSLLNGQGDEEKNRRAALKAYALGQLALRDGQYLEALNAFEKAAQLDPQAVAVHKALMSIYATLNRQQDALDACRKALQLDPGDAEVWHTYARLQQGEGKYQEAQQILKEGLQKIKIDEHLHLAHQMYYDLGLLQEDAKAPLAAVKSYVRSAELLQKALEKLAPEPFQQREMTVRRALIHERIGKLYAAARRFDDAIAAYRKAQKIHPENAARWNFDVAKIAAAQGRHQQALQYLDEYLPLKPYGLEAYELRIELLQKLNRVHEILPWLERATTADRFNMNLKLLLARQYALHNQPRNAEPVYLQVVKDNPRADVYRELFRFYDRSPIFTTAKILERLNQALAKTDDEEPIIDQRKAKRQAQAMISALREENAITTKLLTLALQRLANRRADLEYETLRTLAYLADENRKPQQAEQFYRTLMQTHNPRTEAMVYSGLIRALWKTKKYQEIINVCQRGLRETRATNHIFFHSELARVLAHLNKTDEALKEADQAIRLTSDSSRLAMQRLRVRLLIHAQRFKEAEAECRKLLREYKQPGDILEIRYVMSYLFSAMRNFSKAEKQLQLILKIDPDNATACNDLGYLWADQGKKLAEAEKLIRKAIALDRQQRQTLVSAANDADQDKAAYIDSLGWVLFRRGQLDEARTELERATKLPDGDDPVIWDHLGDVYFRLDMTDQALQSWRTALRLHEDDPHSRRQEHYRDLQEKIRQLE